MENNKTVDWQVKTEKINKKNQQRRVKMMLKRSLLWMP